MSSSERNISRRSVAFAALFAVPALLAGCFRPLYGDLASGASMSDELASIDVPQIEGFYGHELRNELMFLLNGGNPKPPRYRLVVAPAKKLQSTIVDTLLGRSEASTQNLNASFKLYPLTDAKELTSGNVIASTSFDRTQQPYAALRAEREAVQRGAKVLAEQIKTQVAMYFANRN